MTQLSDDLERSLRTFCHHMDGVDDLRKSIEWGGLTFFVSEFADAVRAGVFTPTLWGELTSTDLDPDEDAQVDADLRYVWATVVPGQPFPGDH